MHAMLIYFHHKKEPSESASTYSSRNEKKMVPPCFKIDEKQIVLFFLINRQSG